MKKQYYSSPSLRVCENTSLGKCSFALAVWCSMQPTKDDDPLFLDVDVFV
jgi:hypothetical protein